MNIVLAEGLRSNLHSGMTSLTRGYVLWEPTNTKTRSMQRGQDEGVCQLPPLYLRLFLNIKICELKRQRCTVFLLLCFAKLPTFGSQILVRNRPCIDILHERKAPISFHKMQISILFRFVFQNTLKPSEPKLWKINCLKCRCSGVKITPVQQTNSKNTRLVLVWTVRSSHLTKFWTQNSIPNNNSPLSFSVFCAISKEEPLLSCISLGVGLSGCTLSCPCCFKAFNMCRWAWSSSSTWIRATKQTATEKYNDRNFALLQIRCVLGISAIPVAVSKASSIYSAAAFNADKQPNTRVIMSQLSGLFPVLKG